MKIGNIIYIVFVLFLFNITIVHGETNDSIKNQSNDINSSKLLNENKVYETNQLNDMYLRELELERELLAQKQQTYDSFLNTLLIWFTLFGIILAVIGFLFYKNIREIKDEVTKELDRNLSEKAQTIIKETMKSTYEEPIAELGDRVTKLENLVGEFRRAIEKGQKKLPEYLEENEIGKNEVQGKNIFEEE